MLGHRSLIAILLVSVLLLGPVEASLLSWLSENFWFLNPSLPNSSGDNSVITNNKAGRPAIDMTPFSILLVLTAFFQPPWTVAPIGIDGGPGQRIYLDTPVNSMSFTGGSNVDFDFSGKQPDHDLDAEYEEAKADLEKAEAYAAQMTARCNQRHIRNNNRLRNKCNSERAQAITARDSAKEYVDAIREQVESAASGTMTNTENLSEDADKEYDAAKEKMDRAVEYANKMAAKCSEQSIQRNYRLRDECYAKRDQAYRERDAAIEEFYTVRDGNKTPASTTFSFPASTSTFPITTAPIFTVPTSTSPTATANQGKNRIVDGKNNNNVIGDDSDEDQRFSGTIIYSGITFGSNGNHAPFSNGITINGPLVYRNGQIESGSIDTTVYGSVYKLRIRQYRGKNGECEEEIMVAWMEKTTGKAIYAKCQYGVSRREKGRENFLLIGGLNENLCVFTTNKNEIFYLNNGKWRKGAFNEDSTKDKELTSSEVSRIQERISKWEEFLVKHKKEVKKIKDLKNVKKETRNKRKEELKALRSKEKDYHKGIIANIKQLRNDEKTKHKLENQNIKNIRKKEGWSERVNKLQSEEDRRHNDVEDRLNKMVKDEDKRHKNEDNKYNTLIDEENSKYDEEIRKLDVLREKEDLRDATEFKQMINQGL